MNSLATSGTDVPIGPAHITPQLEIKVSSGGVVALPAQRDLKCVQWNWGTPLQIAAAYGDFSEFGIGATDPAKVGDRITNLFGQPSLEKIRGHFQPSVNEKVDPAPFDIAIEMPAGKMHLRLETVLEIDKRGDISLFSYWQDISPLKKSQNQADLLQQVVDSIPSWLFVKNTDHNYEMVNSAYATFYGTTPELCVGKNSIDLGVSEKAAKGCKEKGIVGFWADDDQVFQSGRPKDIQCEPLIVDQQTKYLQTYKTPILDPESGKPLLVGFCHDITYLKLIETQIGIELRHNKTLNDVGIILNRFEAFEQEAQSALCKYLVGALDCEDVRVNLAEQASDSDAPDANIDYLQVPITFRTDVLGSLTVLRKSSEVVLDDHLEALLTSVAEKLAVHVNGLNLLAKINHQANHDSLTGLPNRLCFSRELNAAIHEADQGNSNCAVALMDLDGFKQINDSLGHHIGDSLLQEVAKRLINTSGTGQIVARLGGDEFAILINGISDQKQSVQIAQQHLEAIQKPYMKDGRSLSVGASFGISFYDGQSSNSSNLLQQADSAMYFAKTNGRNNCQKFTQSIADQNNNLLKLEQSLHRAISNDNELFLTYQPKYDLKTNLATSVEALVRWQSPEFGLLMPSEFITMAEKTGLILPLGEWIMKKAFSTVAKMNRELASPIQLSINVTPPELEQDDYCDKLLGFLSDAGLDPHYLDLELTETFMMNRFEEVSRRLSQLQSKGIQISIDDFGAGYSCMKYLQHLPIDCLKIDKSFVVMLDFPPEEHKPKQLAIAEAIVRLAKSIGLKTVAEGIETQNQLHHALSLGADFGQGFLFSEPLLETDALNLFVQQQQS